MKIYRRSIKKSTSMYTLKPIVVILALFLLMTIGNLKGFLVFLVILHYFYGYFLLLNFVSCLLL